MEPYNIEEKRPRHPGYTVPEYLTELRREKIIAIGMGVAILFVILVAVGMRVL